MIYNYLLQMWDDSGADHNVELEASDLADAVCQVQHQAEEWVEGGDWGIEGASVLVRWKILVGADDSQNETGEVLVEVPPDEEALMKKAGADMECEHEFTREGEQGCRENPGVWSIGGTTLLFSSHCKHCGLRKIEKSVGSQRNPGEHDTIEFELPEKWCSECQCEDCNHL